MKKIFLFLTLVFLVLAVACKKNELNNEQELNVIDATVITSPEEQIQTNQFDKITSLEKSKEFFTKLGRNVKEKFSYLRPFELEDGSFILFAQTSSGLQILSETFEDVIDPRISYSEIYTYKTEHSSRSMGIESYPNHGYDKNLIPVKKNSLWGFVKIDDDNIIPAISYQFENVHPFKENLAGFSVHNKWGFINIDGKIVIEPEYDKVNDFYNGICIAEISTEDTTQIYAIDLNGNKLFTIELEKSWGRLFNFYEHDYALVEDRGLSIINRNGEIILDNVSRIGDRGGPSDPCIGFNENGFAAFNFFDQERYKELQSESKATYYCVINKDCEIVYKDFNKDYSLLRSFMYEEKNEQSKVNLSSEISSLYDSIEEFIPNFFEVEQDEKVGIIDRDGNIIVPIKYNYIYKVENAPFLTGYFDGHYGYIDAEGWVIEPSKKIEISHCKNGVIFAYEKTNLPAKKSYHSIYRVRMYNYQKEEIFSNWTLYETVTEDGI